MLIHFDPMDMEVFKAPHIQKCIDDMTRSLEHWIVDDENVAVFDDQGQIYSLHPAGHFAMPAPTGEYNVERFIELVNICTEPRPPCDSLEATLVWLHGSLPPAGGSE